MGGRGTVLIVVVAIAAFCSGPAGGQPVIPPEMELPSAPMPLGVLSQPPASFVQPSPPLYGTLPYAQLAPVVMPEPLPDWPRWYAGATGLVMTRTLPNGAATSVLTGHGVVLSTSNAGATWPGGVDLHVGRWLGAHQEHAIEAVYWGVYNMGAAGSVTDPANQLQAIPQAPGVTVGNSPASAFLQNARSQEISRNDLVNNVEINWVYAPMGRPEFFNDGDGPVTFTWLAGFRFFELQDILNYTSLAGTVPPGATFGVNGGANQLGLNIATNNNIYGAQVGAKADWHLLPQLRLLSVGKFMIGGNSITDTSSMAAGNGVVATFAGGAPVQVHSTASTFSYLGSLDAGLAWDVTRHWSLSLGYRVVGVGNIAQSDPSWPTSVTSAASLSHINTVGSTFVHGGFAGFEGRY
jgi:hypothetical protein